MNCKINSKAAFALIMFLLLPGVSYALTDDQKSLVGLKGVMVLVEPLDPEVERLGLTRDQIQTDVELRLRKAGIRVLTEKECLGMPGRPFLHLSIGTIYLSTGPGVWSFAIRVNLNEIVTNDRGIKVCGVIWEDTGMGTTTSTGIKTVRDKVNDLVEKFINDYLAANPK